MATTIQTIETPKKYRALDTSGNNNHGQIYSGRGLEFDGVTDYLDGGTNTNLIFNNGDHTLVAWFNGSSFPSSYNYILSIGNDAAGKQSGIGVRSDNRLFCSAYSSPIVNTTATVEANTWYRLVMVYTGGTTDTADFYLNGVLVEQESIALDVEVGKLRVGSNTANSSIFTGMMSDVQIWDTAWSATDVTYDYLNPELLALNNSGTSLTNSNLKLWYPMQDGHRGQQSYILDGANSGLGDELITEGDFGGGGAAWTTTTGWDDTGGSGAWSPSVAPYNDRVYQSLNFVVGTSYKFTFTISNNTNGRLLFRLSGATNQDINTTYTTYADGDHTIYFTSKYANTVISLYGHDSYSSFNIDNVSVKAINDKNHATTVFYGDELVENGTMEVDDNWANYHTGTDTNERSTTQVHGGTYSRKLVSVDTTTGGIQSDNFTSVTGRTYVVNFWVYPDSGTVQRIGVRNGADSDWAVDNNFTGLTQDDWNECEITYTEAAGGGAAYIVLHTNQLAHTMYIDNVSIKEVGLASGWTDADQQLHIPQTALQSYNELAWFDGVADYTLITDHDDFSFGNGTTDEPFSISAWIYMNDATTFPIVSKYSTSHKEWFFKTDGSDKLKLRLYDNSAGGYQGREYSTALTSYEGKWTHVVATYSGDESDADAGINLYVNGEVVDDTDSSSGSYTAMENKDGDVTIGAELAGTSKFANGSITGITVHSAAINASKVKELYNDGKELDATTFSGVSAIEGYWRNNGLSTWQDLTSNDRDGTPTSVTETILLPAGVDATRDNQGFIMNRQKDTSTLNFIDSNATISTIPGDYPYVNAGPNPISIASFSFSAWVKIPHILATIPIFQLGDDNNNHFSIFTTTGSSGAGDIRFSHEYDSTLVRKTTNTGSPGDNCIAVDTWHNIVFTATTTTVILYVDGVAQTVVDQTGTGSSLTDRNTYIGYSETGKHFVGQIDNVLVYDDVLTQVEVTRNYNAGKGSHRN